MTIAQGGLNWIMVPLTLGIITIVPYFILHQLYLLIIAILWFLLTGFFILFFRDPSRVPPNDPKLIVAPADGRILKIEKIDRDRIRICTFMNVYNVHVNRIPLDGQIINMTHKLGGFKPAYDKESDQNERVEISMRTKLGKVDIIQIAGILARRIEPYIEEKENVKRGQRFGIIRLGSRVDLILPAKKVKILVKTDENVMAGITAVAKIN